MWRLIALVAVAATLVIGLFTVGLNRVLESQIFFPDRFMMTDPSQAGLTFQDIRFKTDDDVELHGWYISAPKAAGLIIFCHGNAGNISHRLDNLIRLNRIGLSVFIFDYRGYGQSHGSISFSGFDLDGQAALKMGLELAAQAGLKTILFGRSLGGVAAINMATSSQASAIDGLILESTFTNLSDMTKVHFPLPGLWRLTSGRLDSLERISQLDMPVLFFHGDQDEIVPYELGQKLYRAASQPKEFVTIKGAGHNDTYPVMGEEYFERILVFVDGLIE